MKIGIFGDSFAASKGPTSWGSLLASMNNCVIENFAERGTSLFYSYLKFVENYEKLDVIILLVTGPGRLYHKDIICPNYSSTQHHLNNMREQLTQSGFINHVKAAEQYFLYLQDDDFDKFVHTALIEKVIELSNKNNKKLIMLPSLGEAMNPDVMPYSGVEFFLDRINGEERKHFGVPIEGMYLERPTLQNHLTDENNLVFAKLLTRIINGEEIKICNTDFNPTPSEDPNNCYYMDEVKKLVSIENK